MSRLHAATIITALLFRRNVELVPRQQQRQVRAGEHARVVEEGGQRGERGARGDVVHEDGAGGAAVVGARHGPEALRPRRVPQLQLDARAPRARADADDLGGELDADGLRG